MSVKPTSAVCEFEMVRFLTSPDKLKCNIIDEAEWLQHVPYIMDDVGISFEGLEPLDERLAIEKVTAFYERMKAAGTSIEGDKGVTILTIPKGLSINLVRVAFQDRIHYVWSQIPDVLGEVTVDRAYRIIITNTVLTGSRDRFPHLQQNDMEKARCSLPKTLEAMVFRLLTLKNVPSRDKTTYTQSSEIIDDCYVAVGAGPTGLQSFSYNYRYPNIGTQGCERL